MTTIDTPHGCKRGLKLALLQGAAVNGRRPRFGEGRKNQKTVNVSGGHHRGCQKRQETGRTRRVTLHARYVADCSPAARALVANARPDLLAPPPLVRRAVGEVGPVPLSGVHQRKSRLTRDIEDPPKRLNWGSCQSNIVPDADVRDRPSTNVLQTLKNTVLAAALWSLVGRSQPSISTDKIRSKNNDFPPQPRPKEVPLPTAKPLHKVFFFVSISAVLVTWRQQILCGSHPSVQVLPYR